MVLHPVDDHTRPDSFRNQTTAEYHHVVQLDERSAAPPICDLPRTSQQDYAIERRCDGAALGQMVWHHRPVCIWEAPVGALNPRPGTNGREIATRARKGFVGGEAWVSLPSSEAKHMRTCQGRGAVCSRVFLQDANRNPMRGVNSLRTWTAEQGRETTPRFSDLDCPSRRPLTQCNSQLHVPQDGPLPKPPIPGAH
jgi:hypothetical protein